MEKGDHQKKKKKTKAVRTATGKKRKTKKQATTEAATTKTKRGLALYVTSLYQVANRWENGSSVKCARNWPTSSAHQTTRGSFVPTMNQSRTRTVTSCHVMANSNRENINAFQL